MTFLILGAGFTGARVAALLRERGHAVTALRTAQLDATAAGAVNRLRALTPAGARVLHSIPSLPGHADAAILEGLQPHAVRVVYLSTTGVYGDIAHVDETTPIAPRTGRELQRAATERAVAAGPWSSLILRPAAIYGPGRGAHVAMAEGRYALPGDGSKYISRIHVDDLAAVAAAALTSDLTGAYPVADEEPCSSLEIATFCARQFGLPMPPFANDAEVPVSRRGNRRVDGRAILRLLRVELRYPSYRQGLPAAVNSQTAR